MPANPLPTLFPQASDLAAFLANGGLDPGSADLTLYLNDSMAEFERRTGWAPFAKESSDSTVYFDPPSYGSFGCYLDLKQGWQTIAITTGCAQDGTGGSALSLGSGYQLETFGGQYDGGVDGRPWLVARFVYFVPVGFPRSIKVVGKRGMYATCPADVFNALMRNAAANLLQDTGAGSSGDVKKVVQGPVTIEYDLQDSGTVRGFGAYFDRVVRRYQRV